VFEIGVSRIRVVWSSPPKIGGVIAYALRSSGRWEIEYDDLMRTYNNLPNHTFLDIYSVNCTEKTIRRLAHLPQDR
jgi:hypothetical protein